ncbi:MAG TPA: YaeQ family protein [Steroidobacteraceae bacterium]|jgi:uncharacterized protein YaeQ
MALGATIYVFNIDLANSDRGVYQPLELRVVRHPSESEHYFWHACSRTVSNMPRGSPSRTA